MSVRRMKSGGYPALCWPGDLSRRSPRRAQADARPDPPFYFPAVYVSHVNSVWP